VLVAFNDLAFTTGAPLLLVPAQICCGVEAGVMAEVLFAVVVGAGVVVGPAVVVVVLVPGFVVAGAEAAACAGGITAFTTGFTHLLGITTAVAMPPIMTYFRTCRRSIPALFSPICPPLAAEYAVPRCV
jgi:hypothetical protein